MIPRTTIDARRVANAPTVSQRAAPESGDGAAKSAGPAAATAERDSTNDPVATPAQAGRTGLPANPAAAPARPAASARRPLASITAWPIVAAKANTSTIVPMVKRASVAVSICSLRTLQGGRLAWVARFRPCSGASIAGSGCGGASGWGSGAPEGRHGVVDLEDEPAGAAGVGPGLAAGAAFRTGDGKVALAHRAAGRPEGHHQLVDRAVRLAGGI